MTSTARILSQRSKAPKLFRQELNPITFASAKMNMFLHDYADSVFAIGDTFTRPGFAAEGAGLKRFDYIVANPMWDETLYEDDQWKRFVYGSAPSSSADWGWLQHIIASLNDNGRAAVVLDTGAVSRGSGSKSSNKEKLVRQGVVSQRRERSYRTACVQELAEALAHCEMVRSFALFRFKARFRF